MTWTSFAQLRDRVIDLGKARTAEKALELARRRAHKLGDVPYCIGCRRQDVLAPDVALAAEVARAFAGFQPSPDVRKQMNALHTAVALRARRKVSIRRAAQV